MCLQYECSMVLQESCHTVTQSGVKVQGTNGISSDTTTRLWAAERKTKIISISSNKNSTADVYLLKDNETIV